MSCGAIVQNCLAPLNCQANSKTSILNSRLQKAPSQFYFDILSTVYFGNKITFLNGLQFTQLLVLQQNCG